MCEPFNGEELKWHAVTPAMSNMRYHADDCAKELKRANIAAFFKPKQGQLLTHKYFGHLCPAMIAGHTGAGKLPGNVIMHPAAIIKWVSSQAQPASVLTHVIVRPECFTFFLNCAAASTASVSRAGQSDQPDTRSANAAKSSPAEATPLEDTGSLAADTAIASSDTQNAPHLAGKQEGILAKTPEMPQKRLGLQQAGSPSKKQKGLPKGQGQISSFFAPNSK